MRRTAPWLLLLLMTASVCAAEPNWLNPPRSAESMAELRTWVEASRGFGNPQSVEAELAGLHIFVTWNCPFSGRNGTYVNTYRQELPSKKWRLIDSSFWERPEPLSHAYVDGRAGSVVYVGTSGKILKEIQLHR